MNVLDAVEEVAALTAGTTNMFGPLSGWVRERLIAVMLDPTQQTWEEAYSLMVNNDRFMTLWQAVQHVDPEFQTSRGVGYYWTYVPAQSTLIAAVRYAVTGVG